MWQGSVGPAVGVFIDELVKQLLELFDRARLDGSGAEPFLERLLEPFDFALGLRVVRFAVLLCHVEPMEFCLEFVPAALTPDSGQPHGEDHAVVGGDCPDFG